MDKYFKYVNLLLLLAVLCGLLVGGSLPNAEAYTETVDYYFQNSGASGVCIGTSTANQTGQANAAPSGSAIDTFSNGNVPGGSYYHFSWTPGATGGATTAADDMYTVPYGAERQVSSITLRVSGALSYNYGTQNAILYAKFFDVDPASSCPAFEQGTLIGQTPEGTWPANGYGTVDLVSGGLNYSMPAGHRIRIELWVKFGVGSWPVVKVTYPTYPNKLIVTQASNANTHVGPGDPLPDEVLVPGGAGADLDSFTIETSEGTDIARNVSVALSPAGSYSAIGVISITDNFGTATYGSVSNPSSDVISVPLTAQISISTAPLQYKVRIFPKTHAAMPPPPGTSYAIQGMVTSIDSSTNPKTYNDTFASTVRIDNQSPDNPAWEAVIPGDTQVTLNWTNPSDPDLSKVLVLRQWLYAVADSPTEGVVYTQGSVIGSSTVACVVDPPGSSCTDTGLSNQTSYYYKVFAKDSTGNYSTGSAAGPFTPNYTVTVGNGTDPYDAVIRPGGSATMLDSFTLQMASMITYIQNLTLTLSSGASSALSKIEITSDSGSVVYGSVTNPSSDSITISLSPNVLIDTTEQGLKIRVTPKSYSDIPPGSTHAITGTITDLTASYSLNRIFSDLSSATVMIDSSSSGKAYNISVDAFSTEFSPYLISLSKAFTVRAKVIDQTTGLPITGLTNTDVTVYKITNMTNNNLLTAGTNYTNPVFTEVGNGIYDLVLSVNSGASYGDILQIEVRGHSGVFVDSQSLSVTHYVKVSQTGGLTDPRYVEIQPSTAGDITALDNASGTYHFKIRIIDGSWVGAPFNPGSLAWSLNRIKDNTGATPAGTFTLSATWNPGWYGTGGGWYDCSLNMTGATLIPGNRYYIVINATMGNYTFTQSIGLTARTSQSTPEISVPAFSEPSLDTTPPIEGSLTVGNDSGNGYVPASFSVTETFTDNESEVKSCEYSLDGANWTSATASATSAINFVCTAPATASQTNGTPLTIRMRATSTGGTSTPVNTLNRTVDALAPADGSLTVTPGYKTNVLSWTAASDAGSGLNAANTYVVVSAAGAGVPADCVNYGSPVYSGPDTSFTHKGLLSGSSYGYRVCAYDKVGNRSSGATGSGATFTDATPPTEIGGTLTVSPDSETHTAGVFTITEDFNDPQTPVSSCKYTIDGSNWNSADTVIDLGGGDYRCTAGNVTGINGLSVIIKMKATSDGGESIPSAALQRTVDAVAPVDGILTVTPGDKTSALTWTASTDSGSGLASNTYKVVFQISATPPTDCNSGTQIYSGPSTSYSHTNLANLTTYSYRVCSYDKVANSSAGATGSGLIGKIATTAGTAVAIPSTMGINVLMPYSDDANENSTYSIDFKLSSDSTWLNWGGGPHTASPFQATVGLAPGQTYDIRVTYNDIDGVIGAAEQILSNIRIASDKLVHNSLNANKKNYWSQYGGWGLPGTQYGEFTCATCHEPRAQNISGIKNFIMLTPVPGTSNHFGGPVNFQSKTGPDGFGDDSVLRDPPPPVSKICEVCHTQTYGLTGPPPAPSGPVHRYNQTQTANHANANGTNCTFCHTHNTGFKAPW